MSAKGQGDEKLDPTQDSERTTGLTRSKREILSRAGKDRRRRGKREGPGDRGSSKMGKRRRRHEGGIGETRQAGLQQVLIPLHQQEGRSFVSPCCEPSGAGEAARSRPSPSSEIGRPRLLTGTGSRPAPTSFSKLPGWISVRKPGGKRWSTM